jgi:hypothetical protein
MDSGPTFGLRALSPFPERTVMFPVSGSTSSTSSLAISIRRMPDWYRNQRIALFRRPSKSLPHTASSLVISCLLMTGTSGMGALGGREILAMGFGSSSSAANQAQKPLSAS